MIFLKIFVVFILLAFQMLNASSHFIQSLIFKYIVFHVKNTGLSFEQLGHPNSTQRNQNLSQKPICTQTHTMDQVDLELKIKLSDQYRMLNDSTLAEHSLDPKSKQENYDAQRDNYLNSCIIQTFVPKQKLLTVCKLQEIILKCKMYDLK